ncbi:hypothetical protein B0H13DRAFT_2274657 [Mycena leptocephala]|nr:hypothetical protein B0H13DRAFT_2274657 [Mycena leptocephala]
MLESLVRSSSLSVSVSSELRTQRLVYAGTTAVCFWDILHSLGDDYLILFKHPFQISTAAYLVSRIASFTYVLGFTLFNTYPFEDCRAAQIAFTSCFVLSCGATGLLFFFRVRAVYGGQHLITRFFGILWLCVMGAATLIPIGIDTTKIQSSCIPSRFHSYVSTPGIVITVYDTSVFLAISYGLLSDSYTDYTFGEMMRALFRGAGLRNLSLALFKGGQKYYMITILVNVLAVVMVFVPGVPLHYRAILSIPNTALNSVMACRVYRDVKLRMFTTRVCPSQKPRSALDAVLPGSAPSARLLRPTHLYRPSLLQPTKQMKLI